MAFDFDDFLEALDEDLFEEKPVLLEEFVTSPAYLNMTKVRLSPLQLRLIRAMTQIFRQETLISLYGEDEGFLRFKETVNEVIAQLGKGSGKDFCSTIAVAYIVYLLLCLKSPQEYFGKAPGDAIDILNIAINAQQAKNVFFKGFKQRIEHSTWFQGKYYVKADAIEFDKSITCYSGHSERESWEGYNVLMVILDEISGFALESTTGHDQAKTAGAIYKMYRASVISRFPEFGKIVLLSFPRFKNDFIQERYNAVVAEKDVIVRTHKFKIDNDREDGIPENEFEISWEEDQIISYRAQKVFALKRPTWEVNPLQSLEHLKGDFFADPVDALSRFACMPPDAIDAFFKSREKVELAFNRPQKAHNEDWSFKPAFQPDPNKEYYIHVDLAHKHDRCAVAMTHVDSWTQIKMMNYAEPAPVVIVDAIRWWTPKPNEAVDFADVRNYITSLKHRGFNIKQVTFDQWQSIEMRNYVESLGIDTERVSVAKKHYEDLAMVIQEERIHGPYNEILIEELLQLRLIRGDKVDHPRKGGKDLADAVCGAVHNAVRLAQRDVNTVIEIQYLEPGAVEQTNVIVPDQHGPIKSPKRDMPADLADFLSGLRVI